MEIIKFYSVSDEFGEFSNFAHYPIKLKGKEWPTSEHYFQAAIIGVFALRIFVSYDESLNFCALLGRSRKVKIRIDWDKIKDSVMYDAV